MRPTFGVRTLDLCSQLFGIPRLAPPALPPTRFLISRLKTAPRSPGVARTPTSVTTSEPAPHDGVMATSKAGHELRFRLVGEYRRRLEVLGATLRSLDETWARDALVRVLLTEQSVDAWAAHLQSVDGPWPIAEPAHDLHAVGEEVRELIATTTARLGRIPRGWSAADGAPDTGRPRD